MSEYCENCRVLQKTIDEYRLEHNRHTNDITALESKVESQQATITELVEQARRIISIFKSGERR